MNDHTAALVAELHEIIAELTHHVRELDTRLTNLADHQSAVEFAHAEQLAMLEIRLGLRLPRDAGRS